MSKFGIISRFHKTGHQNIKNGFELSKHIIKFKEVRIIVMVSAQIKSSYGRIHFLVNSLGSSKALIALFLWIVFIGYSLWNHAAYSQQPPIFDAATYYLKAFNFWTEVGKGSLFNPFNIYPSIRPPGTILMAYPFGFEVEYSGFYFRSIFLPILLIIASVFIAVYRHEMNSKSKWLLTIIALFISNIPILYNFEYRSFEAPAYWGLVDNFLTGAAALAAAATVRSIWTKSLIWLVLAASLASFCLLIKPSGVLIMMLIGLSWAGMIMLRLNSVWQSTEERKSLLKCFYYGILIFFVTYMSVLLASFSSQYLSAANLAFGKGAVAILQADSNVTLSVIFGQIHVGLGYPFAAWFFLMLNLVVLYVRKAPKDLSPWSRSSLVGCVVFAGLTLLVGIWFWIFRTGVQQIRYFIPFVLVTVVFMLPAIIATMRALPRWKTAIISTLMILPIMMVGVLLPQRSPSSEWQQWLGIHITSGVDDPVTAQAQDFVTKVKQEGEGAVLYLMSMGMADAAFTAVIERARITHSPMPRVSLLRPIDWQRSTTFRKDEMLNANYWLIKPEKNQAAVAAALASHSVKSFRQEVALFQAWATQLTTNDGVVVVSETPTTRLLRIANYALLESAYDKLVTQHQWRSIFLNANPDKRTTETDIDSE